MALVLGWVVPALTSLLARTSPQGAARLNLAALPAAALLLAALSLAMPWTPYQRPAWADRALQHLTNQAVRLGDGLLEGSGPFGIGSGGGRLADADGSVSLSDAGPLRFSGRTVLEVETDLTGRIYLRGLSDAVYDGESWQPLDEAAYNWQARLHGVTYGAPAAPDTDLGAAGAESLFAQFQPMNFPALAVRDAHPGSPYARITVRNVGADPGYVYVPYHILTQPGELSGAEFVHDAYLARAARVRTHTIYVQPDASPAASAGLRGELSLAEAAYADFVREYYLQVPLYSENPALRQALDGALEPLADWLRQAQYVSPAAVKQPYELEAAQVVADYLAARRGIRPRHPRRAGGGGLCGLVPHREPSGLLHALCQRRRAAAAEHGRPRPLCLRLCGRRARLRPRERARLRRPRLGGGLHRRLRVGAGGGHPRLRREHSRPERRGGARGHPLSHAHAPGQPRPRLRRAHTHPHAVGGPPE